MEGKIVGGECAGFFIRIESVSEGALDCLILIWREDPRVGYDYWVENVDDIGPFLEEVGWQVEWLK